MRKNYKITIEYDGTDFVGWQRQANGRSVQGEIEQALQRITSSYIPVTGAGRTDAGVHARGQVANFFLDTNPDESDLLRSINGLVGRDIVIHDIETVPDSFSARYSATAREYSYFISPTPAAIGRQYSWQIGYRLDLPLMNDAASMLIGARDFRSFCRTASATDDTQCTVSRATWEREGDGRIVFHIRANRFLHGMVRAIVGTIIDIGRGHMGIEALPEILSSLDRRQAGQAAPPHGLFLERVIY
jgi:tRNA pseudouridine38-40 synthase